MILKPVNLDEGARGPCPGRRITGPVSAGGTVAGCHRYRARGFESRS